MNESETWREHISFQGMSYYLMVVSENTKFYIK